MTTVHLNAHSTQAADANWQLSPLYLAGMDALRAVCPDADPTPLGTTKHAVGPDWPHPDRAVRDRFHRRWTDLVLERCGIDPLTATPATAASRYASMIALTTAEAEAVVVRYRQGETMSSLAECFEVNRDTIAETLRRAGVPSRGNDHARLRALREPVVVAYRDSTDTVAAVALRFGVSLKFVNTVLRDAGIAVRPADHAKAAQARWTNTPTARRKEIVTLYVRDGLDSNAIAARIGITPQAVTRHLRRAGVARSRTEVWALVSEDERKARTATARAYKGRAA